jgi:ATP sulfurylase
MAFFIEPPFFQCETLTLKHQNRMSRHLGHELLDAWNAFSRTTVLVSLMLKSTTEEDADYLLILSYSSKED